MDREPAGVDDAGWRAPGRAPASQRRLVVAGLAAGMVLLLVIAVLATRLASVPAAQSAAVTDRADRDRPTARLTVPTILPAGRAVRGPHPGRP